MGGGQDSCRNAAVPTPCGNTLTNTLDTPSLAPANSDWCPTPTATVQLLCCPSDAAAGGAQTAPFIVICV